MQVRKRRGAAVCMKSKSPHTTKQEIPVAGKLGKH
jgi:hypothetical protein